MSDSIEELRARIDGLDDIIATAIAKRREVVEMMRETKKELGVAFIDPAREAAIEDRYSQALPQLTTEQTHALVRAVLESTR